MRNAQDLLEPSGAHSQWLLTHRLEHAGPWEACYCKSELSGG